MSVAAGVLETMRRAGAALAVIALVSSCSNRELFDAVQHNQALECSKLPQAQYEECMREIDVSYEEYERAREAREKAPQGTAPRGE